MNSLENNHILCIKNPKDFFKI